MARQIFEKKKKHFTHTLLTHQIIQNINIDEMEST